MGNLKGDMESVIVTEETQKVYGALQKHVDKAIELYGEERIFGVFVQGSYNYKLDYEGSDVDTKCLLIPSLEDIILNRKPVSTTVVLDNDEHLDVKDIRLYFNTIRKQNINFVEILFTDYYWVNRVYKDDWLALRFNRDAIAHLDPARAVKCMYGMALEKYHALKKDYPCQAEEIAEFGYASKQLHHMLRLEYFVEHYIAGDEYIKCLVPSADIRPALIQLKATPGLITLDQACDRAESALTRIKKMVDDYCEKNDNICDKFANNLLDEVLTDVIKESLKKELL